MHDTRVASGRLRLDEKRRPGSTHGAALLAPFLLEHLAPVRDRPDLEAVGAFADLCARSRPGHRRGPGDNHPLSAAFPLGMGGASPLGGAFLVGACSNLEALSGAGPSLSPLGESDLRP